MIRMGHSSRLRQNMIWMGHFSRLRQNMIWMGHLSLLRQNMICMHGSFKPSSKQMEDQSGGKKSFKTTKVPYSR